MAEDILKMLKDTTAIPTGYFEAKPQRVVEFNEAGTAQNNDMEISILYGKGVYKESASKKLTDPKQISILKTECIYRHKPTSFNEANEMIDRYIYFYNHERIQLKTGVAPLTLRHSA